MRLEFVLAVTPTQKESQEIEQLESKSEIPGLLAPLGAYYVVRDLLSTSISATTTATT